MGTTKRYPEEVRERAVRMVAEQQAEHGSQWGAIQSIAGKIGCTPESLRRWVRQAERDHGERAGMSSSERERASLDLTTREFFVSGVAGAGTGSGGRDNIGRADISLTLRVHRQHGVALKYLWSRRDATFPNVTDLSQVHGTIGLYYAYLGKGKFGAVE